MCTLHTKNTNYTHSGINHGSLTMVNNILGSKLHCKLHVNNEF